MRIAMALSQKEYENGQIENDNNSNSNLLSTGGSKKTKKKSAKRRVAVKGNDTLKKKENAKKKGRKRKSKHGEWGVLILSLLYLFHSHDCVSSFIIGRIIK